MGINVAGHDRGSAARCPRTDSKTAGTTPYVLGSYRALAVDGIYLRYRRSAKKPGTKRSPAGRAVGVREGARVRSIGLRLAAEAETSQAYEELFTRLWQRGLEQVDLVISDGAEGAVSAAAVVYAAAAHQLCLAHWFRNLEGLTPRLQWWQRRKFRREFWWIFEAEQETQLRKWAGSFARRAGVSGAPEMVREVYKRNCRGCWPTCDSLGMKPGDTASPYDEFMRKDFFVYHLRRYLGPFSWLPWMPFRVYEQVLGCYLLAAERMHA